MNTDRIKEIQQGTAYPESVSVQQALLKVWNETAQEQLRIGAVSKRFSEPELKNGFVKIEGCDNATGFERICKESELQKVGKEIFAEHPGEDGYYNFTKFLWVKYPDGRPEHRLDDVVPYD